MRVENNSAEIKAQIKQLKLISKRILHSSLAGEFSSVFKGSGFDFHQLREYQDGDDARLFDWKSFAKTGNLLVKEMIPERDRTLIIALDCSKSMLFSSQEHLKKDTAAAVAASLAFIAENTKDKVGLVLFSEKIIMWLPPKKGKIQSTEIIEKICEASHDTSSNKVSEVLKFLSKLKKKNSMMFIISDWIFSDLEKQHGHLSLLAKMYDMTAVRVLDPTEISLPEVGLLKLEDSENQSSFTCHSASTEINAFLESRAKWQEKNFLKMKIGFLNLLTTDNPIRKLRNFLNQKARVK